MTINIEDLAEEGAQASVPDRQTPVEPASPLLERLHDMQRQMSQSLVRCFYCSGLGTDRQSKWSHLWGGACWICAGWGVVVRGQERLRGPSGPHPARRLMRG